MDDAERKAAEAANEEIRAIIRTRARRGNDDEALIAFATLDAADRIVAKLDDIGRELAAISENIATHG